MQTLKQRFWSKINKNGPTIYPELGPCWLWTGHIRKADGYGNLEHQGKPVYAHRVAFYLSQGRWPAPHCLHKCDNPSCVRFTHLFEGNDLANAQDRNKKHRDAHGIAHGRAKLTLKQIKEMRRLHTLGLSTIRLGIKFKVHQMTAWRIVNRKIWKHVL